MTTALPSTRAYVHLEITRAVAQIGSEETVRQMLPMLQELLERDAPQIGRLLDNTDMPAANVLLHTLKGCLPIFCTPALSVQLAQVELMSKTAGNAEVCTAYAELRPKLDELRHEVERYLNG